MMLTRLFAIRDQAERLRMALGALVGEEQPAYWGKLREQIDLIREVLDHSHVPPHVRIADVGTFKTSPSSFVNARVEERLAGVETNPETVALLSRGQLTEAWLSKVDRILLLTRSGAAFSQGDKERLVRRVDIRRTLDELLDETAWQAEEGSDGMAQLDALHIYCTSARWCDEGNGEASGIKEVKKALFEVLSTNYHLQQLVHHLVRTMHATRSRLRAFVRERCAVMDTEADPQKIERSIEALERHLSSHVDRFEERMQALRACHDKQILEIVR